MNQNPYASSASNSETQPPGAPSPGGDALTPLQAPGISFIVLAVMGLINVVAGFLIRVAMGTITFDLGDPVFQGNLFGGFLILVCHVVCLQGGRNMMRGANFRNTRASAIIMCFPCLTPCIVLGIPFGIWALVVLARVEVRQAFHS